MRHSRVAIVAIVMVAALMGTAARKGASRSGSIKDNVFNDATYKYQVTLSDDWKTTLYDDDSPMRLLLAHKTLKSKATVAGGLQQLRNIDGSETPAKAEFWVVTDSTIGEGLVDSIVSGTYKSQLKDKILASPEGFWQISGFERTEGGARKLLKFGDKEGTVWKGAFIYKSTAVSHVALGIGLLSAHCGSYELLSLVYCEPKILDSAVAATAQVMQSLK